jgi:type II secretory ATPase GspE/PulE/Tfp pilus assembly ATPase PilB-like protein
MHAAVVSRIKIMSNLDIAERRLPQDGKCKINTGSRRVDIRVSTLPTIYGEKIVMRLLDRGTLLLDLEDLGFDPEDLIKFQLAIRRPHGMILLTGPTGSGKSTTLYAGLNFINSPEKNIVTVEDPVEYELEGINQIQMKPQIGLTFAQALRHILRQDPDIIMIGEIRDRETAEIAIQSALTGHLVLSTLHTNDAVSTINRLVYMGVEPYLIVAALDLVIAQRLVRRICLDCKEAYAPMEGVLDTFGLSGANGQGLEFYCGRGCAQCGRTGYLGRVALYEVFSLTDRIKQLILGGADEGTLREEARRDGMKTLMERGLGKVLGGITTFEEVLGVTSVDGKIEG